MVEPAFLVCNCSRIFIINDVPTFNVHISERKPYINGTMRFADILFPGPLIDRNYGFTKDEKEALKEYVWSNRHLLTLMAYEQGFVFMAPSPVGTP